MNPIIYLLYTILQLYGYVLITWVILSWLIHFNIINRHQPVVNRVDYILHRLTEPVLRYVRQIIPSIGGIDLSPILLFIFLRFVQYTLVYYFV